MALVVVVGALSSMALVPLGRPGVGWLLAAIITGGLLAWIAGDTATDDPTGSRLANAERAGWALATVALLAVGAVRDAGWLFLLCVVLALVTGTIAVSRARTPLGVAMAILTLVPGAIRGIPWLGRGIAAWARRRWARSPSRGYGDARVVLAAVLGSLLTLALGLLLSLANPSFAGLMGALLPDLDELSLLRGTLVLVGATTLALGGAFLIVNPTRYGDATLPAIRPMRRVELALPLAGLVGVLGLFSLVQLVSLFGDDSHVLQATGLTPAEFARGTMAQLVVVSVASLAIMALASHLAPRETPGDRALVRGIMAMTSLFALIAVCSALRGVWLYEQAHGLTRWRVAAVAADLWLAALFAMLALSSVRLRAGWVPRMGLAAAVAVLLGLAVANPDQLVASENVARYQRTGDLDVDYARGLSADAAAELNQLPEQLRACALSDLAARLEDPGDWTEYNYGRQVALGLDLPDGDPSVVCH